MKEIILVVKDVLHLVGPKTRQTIKIGTSTISIIFLFFYLPFVHYLDVHQAGIGWNWISGEVRLTNGGGFYLSPPWMMVSRIDKRPRRVCITSTTRAVNCKLVQFEPKAFHEFVKTEGFRYYWWSNRISFNWGYDEEYRGMHDVLRGYAYSVQKYPFLTVLREYD